MRITNLGNKKFSDNMERNLLQQLFKKGRTPDLIERRAVNPTSGKPMPHSVSRHRDFGEERLFHTDGNILGQGSLFPPHIKAGQVSKIEKYVLDQWLRDTHGYKSNLIESRPAGDAIRVRVKLKKYGIKEVGGFIRDGEICTVFPEDS